MRSYDELTESYFRNPKLIWQHTLSGEKNFDSCNFLGALKDLSSIPDWKDAFKGADNIDGFLTRFEAYIGVNGNLSPDENGRSSLYFSPKSNETNSEKLILLAQNHLKECTKVAALDQYGDDTEMWVNKLSGMKVQWVENGSKSDINHESDPALYLYETVSEVFSDHQNKWSHFHYCLSEACYGLAADYSLQRYLMQDFYDLDINLSYLYELEWVHGGQLHFSDETCFVYA